MDRLTARQQQIFDLIRDNIEDTGYPPTRAEIAQQLGFKSANAAEDHLRALARKGVIEMIPGASRGIRIVLGVLQPVSLFWQSNILRIIKKCHQALSIPTPITFCACRVRA